MSPQVTRTPVAEWPARERPLSKLCSHGPAALSNAELLSLLIPRGTHDPGSGELLTRLDLARSLLREQGSLENVLTASPPTLAKHPGIGHSTAGALASAGLLTARLEAEQAGQGERLQISCPEDAAAAYGPEMRGLSQEVFKVLCLSASNTVTAAATLSRGGLTASIVEPRAVYKFAIQQDAAAVLALHNHPSGNKEPSKEDIRITRQLTSAGEHLGVPLHDHLIIAGRGYTSLAERGII